MNKHLLWYLKSFILTWMSLALPVQAATFTVTSADDVGEGTLRTLISNAVDGDKIEFNSNDLTNETISLGNGEIVINHNLTIDGTDAKRLIISAENSSRIFNVVDGASLTLKNLRLTGGNTAGAGGAIYIQGHSNLIIENVTFQDNHSSSVGGAIYIEGNSAIEQAIATIKNATFYGNSAANGGGAVMVGHYAKATISNSTLVKNYSSAANTGTLEVEPGGELISQNNLVAEADRFACQDNGGIFNLQNTMSDDDSCGSPAYTHLNYATAPDYHEDEEIIPTIALLPGSDAINKGDNSLCDNQDARGENRPTPNNGKHWQRCDVGAYEFQRPMKKSTVDNRFNFLDTDESVGNNTLRKAIYYADPGDNINFDLGTSEVLIDSEIRIDKNLNISGENENIVLNGGGSTRIFIIDNNASVNLKHLTFINGDSGSGHDGGAILVRHANVTIDSATFAQNSSPDAYGGAIGASGHNEGQTAVVEINNATFFENSARGGGAVNVSQYADVTITNSTLSHNSTEPGDGSLRVASDGFVDMRSTVIAYSNKDDCLFLEESSRFIENVFSADHSCSEKYIFDSDPKLKDTLTIAEGSDVPTLGLLGDSPLINVGTPDVCTSFDARRKPRPGGDNGWSRCDVGAYEFQLPSNNLVVTSTEDSFDDDVSDGQNSLREAIFYANPGNTVTFSETLTGATLNLTASITIADNLTITGNDRQITLQGAGNHSLFLTEAGNITFENLTFSEGQGNETEGGAITNSGATTTIKNSTFKENSTSNNGGAILNKSGNILVELSTFYNNSADVAGGTLFNQPESGLTLKNVTIANSSGTGDVYNEGELNLYNTLIASSDETGCTNENGGTLGSNVNNLISDGSCNADISGSPFLSASLADNGGDTKTLALLAGSPAINAGDGGNCLPQDQRGESWEETCDIGAFAYSSAAGDPPAAPSDLTATFNPPDEVQLSWSHDNIDVSYFIIKRNDTELDTSTTLDYLDTSVECGLGTLTYTVAAVNDNGTSAATSTEIEIEACEGGDPELTATAISPDTIEVNWKDISSNESGYALYRDGDSIIELAANSTAFTDAGLLCNKEYVYQLFMNEGDGFNPISPEVFATTQACTTTEGDVQLSTSVVTSNSIELIWTDISDSELAYYIERNDEIIAELPADTTTFTDSPLDCDTPYTYRVLINEGTQTVPVSSEVLVGTQACVNDGEDAQLQITSIDSTFIELSWTDISSTELAYYIERNGEMITDLPPNSITFRDEALSCNTTYTYQVFINEGAGVTPTSSEVIVKTRACQDGSTSPDAQLRAADITAEAITLNWTDISDTETAYHLERDGIIIAQLPANEVAFVDTQLACETVYSYRLLLEQAGQVREVSATMLKTRNCLNDGDPNRVLLSLTAENGGTIQDCGRSCEQQHPRETTVTLSPMSAAGYVFEGWSSTCGATSNTEGWQVLMNKSRTCVAKFKPVDTSPPPATDNPTTGEGNEGETGQTQPRPAPSSGGVVGQPTQNSGQVATDVTVTENASLSGGSLAGDIDNQGIIANVTVEENSTVNGGTLSGTVDNQGTIQNATISQYSKACGGKFGENITNKGILCDFEVLTDGEIKGGEVAIHVESRGILVDIEIEKGTSIVGGKLSGTVTGHPDDPAQLGEVEILPDTVLEHVRLSPTVELPDGVTLGAGVLQPADPNNPTPIDFGLDPTQYANLTAEQIQRLEAATFNILLPIELTEIPATAFAGLSAQDLAQLKPSTLEALSPEQFAAIPLEALSGLNAANLMGLPAAIIKQLDSQQLAALQASLERDAAANGQGVAKVLSHLDTQKISKADMEALLETLQWETDTQTGVVNAPAGSKLTFRTVNRDEEAPLSEDAPQRAGKLEMPELPDIDSHLAISGEAANTSNTAPSVKEGLQTAIDETAIDRYKLSQADSGVLKVEGLGNLSDIKLTFIPDVDNMVQLPVTTDEERVPVGLSDTDGGFQVVTTPQGYQFTMIPTPQDPAQLAVLVGEAGKVKVNKKGDVWLSFEGTLRRDNRVHRVVIFDAFIETAPPNTVEGIYEDKVVYPDGTLQRYQPTVPYPDIFITTALSMAGVEDVIFNVDGTFRAWYYGAELLLVPGAEVSRSPLRAGQRVLPAINAMPNGEFLYQVQDNLELLKVSFSIVTP